MILIMDKKSLSNWLKYINEWVNINGPYTIGIELKRTRFIDFKFSFLDTKSKKTILNILLKKDNIELLTTQYNKENNLYILKQLNPIISSLMNLNSGFYFGDNSQKIISYKYIILYYLFFCSNDIVEKIHWSYFRIDLLNSLIKNNIILKKSMKF